MSDADEKESQESGADSMTFEAFIFSLATQALIQLGEMPPPPGIEVPKDVKAAKQTIDIINMLKDKTKGNLSSEEERVINDMLHNLRMGVIRHG